MTKKTKNAVNFAHDHFFRLAMEDLQVAKSFFQQYLPVSQQAIIDLDTLQPLSSSFVSHDRQGKVGDILFKVSTRDKRAFICLLVEHQSTADDKMPLRIAEYVHATMRKYQYRDKDSRKLRYPFVIPLVFYHGKRPYPYDNHLRTSFEVPTGLVKLYFAACCFQLIDVTQIPDEILLQYAWSGLLSCVSKHIYDPDFSPCLATITRSLNELWRQGSRDFVRNIVHYISDEAEISSDEFKTAVNNITSDEIRGKMMKIADYYQQKGKQEGLEQGLERGSFNEKTAIARRMLTEGITVELIAKITDLSQNNIESLKSENSKRI